MKKYILFGFMFIAISLSAQEAFYTKTLKELIAFETLIKENRISDLSKLIDESLYTGQENNSFYKSNINDKTVPDDMFVWFIITDDKSLAAVIGNNESVFEMTKAERNHIWVDFFSVIETGFPYAIHKYSAEYFEDEKGDSLQFEKISRYEFRYKVDGKYDWITNKASNFFNGSSNEKHIVYSFFGPGQLSHIDILVPRDDDKGWEDEVSPFFYVVGRDLQESQPIPSPIDIPFFMSLKNFNDRIWSDN